MPHDQQPSHPVARLAHRLGPSGLVVALAGLVLLGVLLAAATDLRRLSAEPQPAPVQDPAATGARSDEPTTQYSVRVTVKGDAGFTVGIRWSDGKKVERTSAGEDVVVTRVFEGTGPYVTVGGQLAATGTVSCRVDVDGRKEDSRKDTGTYAQAICAA